MSNVSFILIDPPKKPFGRGESQKSLVEEWQDAFAQHLQPRDLERFSFLEKRLNQLQEDHITFDCIVSPANSYGIMDGGFDFHLSRAFSPQNDFHALTRLVQAAIRDRYYGFAPPGTCTLVSGLSQNEFSCKVIAVCPTMRYPEELTWHKDIVYNTTWSLLVELEHWNKRVDDEEEKIHKVLMTGLGTGCGNIQPADCARHMALAVKHFLYARREEGQNDQVEGDFLSWHKVKDLIEEVSNEALRS